MEACGYPGQVIRGDCFIGRVFDDTEASRSRNVTTLVLDLEEKSTRVGSTTCLGAASDLAVVTSIDVNN